MKCNWHYITVLYNLLEQKGKWYGDQVQLAPFQIECRGRWGELTQALFDEECHTDSEAMTTVMTAKK